MRGNKGIREKEVVGFFLLWEVKFFGVCVELGKDLKFENIFLCGWMNVRFK